MLMQGISNNTATILEDDKMDEVGGLSIVDEALADIVLVKKPEMEEWQRKQEHLK